jgi:SAM-dependent methyltransferase
VDDGVLSFAGRSTRLGEFSNEEMHELLSAARELGWRKVLEERMAKRNRAVLELILDRRRSSFLSLMPGAVKGVAIDLGCGYGGISLQLARSYREVFAVDSGLERLGFLNVVRQQERIDNILPIHHENITALPFPEHCADLIALVGVFEYLPLAYPESPIAEVQQRVLGELARVLKPGGYLYIGTKNRFGWPYLTGASDHNRLRFGPALPRPLADWLTRRLYGKPYRVVVDSYPAYRRLLREAGFADARFYWPSPGYQFPDRFVPLDGEARPAVPQSAGWKGIAVSTLASLGLLRFVAPHFAIVASKT